VPTDGFNNEDRLLNPNMPNTKKNKKKWIIGLCLLTVLCISLVVFIFKNGYRLPQRDKHKQWQLFPNGSNPAILISPLDSLYVFALEPMLGTDLFLVSFQSDSIKFNDVNSGVRSFAIIDHRGKVKLRYDNDVTVSYDHQRVVITVTAYGQQKSPFYCDIYDLSSQKISRQVVSEIKLPQSLSSFAKGLVGDSITTNYNIRFQNSFFKNLRGLKSFEINYSPSDPTEKGYLIYTDPTGKLYSAPAERDGSFYALCPQCEGYVSLPPAFNHIINGTNIKQSDSSIIDRSNFRYGIDVGFSNHQGRVGIFYLNAYQTWLMYHTITMGNKSTSFKTEGGTKDQSYINFYQLNTVKNEQDTLYILADDRIWQVRQR